MNKRSAGSFFNQFSRSSQSVSYKNLMFFKYSNTTKTNCLYLMVGKKYGTAIQRNQLKRWVRVLYRDLIKNGFSVGLAVRPLKPNLSFHETRLCFDMLRKQIQGL